MAQTLVVSGRGQITLPATTRKRFGIKGGDVVILEDRGSEIVLKPGIVLEVQQYSDDQIARWDADDRLADRERAGHPGCGGQAEVRVFLDANVLFTAAHNPQGKAALVIELGRRGHWALATSRYALEEARRNLDRKFPQSLDGLKPAAARCPVHRPSPGSCGFPPHWPRRTGPSFKRRLTGMQPIC